MVYDGFRRHLADVEASYAILEKENFALRCRLEALVSKQGEDISRKSSSGGRVLSDAFVLGSALNDVELQTPARALIQDGVHSTLPRQTAPSPEDGAIASKQSVGSTTEGVGVPTPFPPSPFRSGKTARFSQTWTNCPDWSDEQGSMRKSIFPNVDDMKMNVRKHLVEKQYDVTDYYKQNGLASIAKHPAFEIVTLIVIGLNAIWIAVDTDYNKENILVEAHTFFQVIENLFCTYFFLELLIRFIAFEVKYNCLCDAWFVFDAVLVFMMVLETWILSLVMVTSSKRSTLGDASVMRLARLLRLTRMARMARLLRAVPELVILVKGMLSAARSVFFTLLLLLVLLYVFAIAFTQLLEDTEVGKEFFSNVGHSMHTLWLFATLIDEISTLALQIQEESILCVVIMDLFILAASLTIMNMLIGVLCEVVTAVAASEREELSLHVVKSKVQKIFYSMGLDEDNNGMISKDEFKKIMENKDAAKAINDLGVDVIELVDMADFFFAQDNGDEEYGREFSFAEFMDMVVQLRGSNTATVKDIMLLRKFISVEMQRPQKTYGNGAARNGYSQSRAGSSVRDGENDRSRKTQRATDSLETTDSLATAKLADERPSAPPHKISPDPPDVSPEDMPLVTEADLLWFQGHLPGEALEEKLLAQRVSNMTGN